MIRSELSLHFISLSPNWLFTITTILRVLSQSFFFQRKPITCSYSFQFQLKVKIKNSGLTFSGLFQILGQIVVDSGLSATDWYHLQSRLTELNWQSQLLHQQYSQFHPHWQQPHLYHSVMVTASQLVPWQLQEDTLTNGSAQCIFQWRDQNHRILESDISCTKWHH